MKLNPTLTKLLTIALALIAILLGTTATSTSKATSAQLTGSCGGAINFARKGKVWSDGVSVNGLIQVNFDTNSIEVAANAFDSSMPKGYKSTNPFSATFTLSAGPTSGSFTLTDTVSPSRIPVMHLLPVNDGKSILVQVKDDDTVGVCQRL
jgi:hypothetical protein